MNGYLYVLSISNGALYRILPKPGLTALNSDANPEGGEEAKPLFTPLKEDTEDGPVGSSDKKDLDNSDACNKLSDRIVQIEEQKDSGGLTENQADELRQRIESMRTNLECQ